MTDYAWCELPSDDEPENDICCGCGKYKDTGDACDCGCSHRELCEECVKNKCYCKECGCWFISSQGGCACVEWNK
jgi:hypothetical protein